MTRNLKALGLALVAVFAMGALTASSASAVTDVFTSPGFNNAWATGTSDDNHFTITGNPELSLKCTTSQFTATIVNKATSVTALAKYTGTENETPHVMEDCTSSSGETKVNMNHCHYNLTGLTGNEHPAGSGKKDGAVWIQCPTIEGKEKEIELINTPTGCKISIHTQTPTFGGVVYANQPNHLGGSAIKVTATVTGITFKTSFVCQLGGLPAEGNDADYTGTVIVTGYEDKGSTEAGTNALTTPIEGKQIGILFHEVP